MRERTNALLHQPARRDFLLHGAATSRTAMGTYVFVFVAFRQDQKQTFAHLHGAPAFWAGKQRRFQSIERSPSFWHRYFISGIIAAPLLRDCVRSHQAER